MRERFPLWERYSVRAFVAAVFGKDYRRHIRKARLAARRAQPCADERQARAQRREEFNRAFEQAQRDQAKGARI